MTGLADFFAECLIWERGHVSWIFLFLYSTVHISSRVVIVELAVLILVTQSKK